MYLLGSDFTLFRHDLTLRGTSVVNMSLLGRTSERVLRPVGGTVGQKAQRSALNHTKWN
jgi:hypothetical protein